MAKTEIDDNDKGNIHYRCKGAFRQLCNKIIRILYYVTGLNVAMDVARQGWRQREAEEATAPLSSILSPCRGKN